MNTDQYRRKLTAILSADVVGYSRLMGLDETATLKSLTFCKTLISDLVSSHRGRVVDAPGDNLLAEFPSAVDAVNCAVAIQSRLDKQNKALPDERQMHFRIGINLDDVIEKEGRLYGDGVNITARIQSLASAGGVCISGSIFDQVAHRLSFGYNFLGEQTVKNIDKPVRVYCLLETEQGRKTERKRGLFTASRFFLASLFGMLLLGGALFYLLRPQATEPPGALPDMAVATPSVMVPDSIPVLAVLPIENLTSDKTLAFFADGMTDDIITNLSQMSGLSVIARNGILPYKGKPTKPQKLAEELGVDYVLEGSVRGAGDFILVNAQLINARNGHHAWAERYDVNIKDVFAMQVDITVQILSALKIELSEKDRTKLQAKGEDYLSAYLNRLEADQKGTDPEVEGRRADLVFWESIKDSKNPAMFKEYLRQFPEGIFAGLARLNVAKKIIQVPRPATAEKKEPPKRTPMPQARVVASTARQTSQSPGGTPHATNGQYEETFWRSIDQSRNTKEYEEFVRKFPDGTFAGLAKIKIEALKKDAALKQAAMEKKQFSMAICTGQFELLGGNIGLYNTFEKIDANNHDENVAAITAALEEALKQKVNYTPRYSFYPLNGNFDFKSDNKKAVLDLSQRDIWMKKIFHRKQPNIDPICELGEKLGVDAVLIICVYYIYPPSTVADLYLVDVRTRKILSESATTNTGYIVKTMNIKNGILKILRLHEKS